MRTHPKPIDTVLNRHAKCPVMEADPDRPEAAYSLEVKRGMARIGLEKLIALVREIPDIRW
jgi:hypothetical protein